MFRCTGVHEEAFGKCGPISTCLSARLIVEGVDVLACVDTRGHEIWQLSNAMPPMESVPSFSEEERGSMRFQPEAGK